MGIRRELEVGINQVHYQESNPKPKGKLSLVGGRERKREGRGKETERRKVGGEGKRERGEEGERGKGKKRERGKEREGERRENRRVG